MLNWADLDDLGPLGSVRAGKNGLSKPRIRASGQLAWHFRTFFVGGAAYRSWPRGRGQGCIHFFQVPCYLSAGSDVLERRLRVRVLEHGFYGGGATISKTTDRDRNPCPPRDVTWLRAFFWIHTSSLYILPGIPTGPSCKFTFFDRTCRCNQRIPFLSFFLIRLPSMGLFKFRATAKKDEGKNANNEKALAAEPAATESAPRRNSMSIGSVPPSSHGSGAFRFTLPPKPRYQYQSFRLNGEYVFDMMAFYCGIATNESGRYQQSWVGDARLRRTRYSNWIVYGGLFIAIAVCGYLVYDGTKSAPSGGEVSLSCNHVNVWLIMSSTA